MIWPGALILLLLPLMPSQNHWVRIPDEYHGSEACVQDTDGRVVGMALMQFPMLDPGMWYAQDADDHTMGRYPSKILAKRAVEKHVGGCPGLTSIDQKKK